MSDLPESGLGRRAVLARSIGDGAVLGAGAGVVYALVVGFGASVGALLSAGSESAVSGSVGVAALAGVVAVPVGLALGTVFGAGFGLAAAAGMRHFAGLEAVVVAVAGGVVLASVIAGAEHVTSGVLAWSAGPLVVGVPAAAWHGWRSQCRVARRRGALNAAYRRWWWCSQHR